MSSPIPAPFSRAKAIAVLLSIACAFAANHVGAKLAFENGAGMLLPIVLRSGVAMTALIAIVIIQRRSFILPRKTAPWQLVMGLLITVQSLFLYSAISRVPVALALLMSNVFPILLALLTWVLGGPRPTARAATIMGIILFGLMFVLNVPNLLFTNDPIDGEWLAGICFALGAACTFACSLWITEHKLGQLPGPVRSVYTIGTVFVCIVIAGLLDAMPGGMALPNAAQGWLALVTLCALYTVAFATLFMCAPRLDMSRNAPAMNVEPVASLIFGWIILGQMLGAIQLVGGAIVLSGIVLLAYSRNR